MEEIFEERRCVSQSLNAFRPPCPVCGSTDPHPLVPPKDINL